MKLVGSGGYIEDIEWIDVLSVNIECNMSGISYYFYILFNSDW